MTSLTFPPGPSRSMVGTTSTSPCGAGPGVLKSLRGSGADLFGNTAGGRGTEHAAYVEAAVVVDDVILTHIEDLGERCAQTVRLHQDVVAASAPNRDDVVAQSIRGTLPPPVDEIGPGHLCSRTGREFRFICKGRRLRSGALRCRCANAICSSPYAR